MNKKDDVMSKEDKAREKCLDTIKLRAVKVIFTLANEGALRRLRTIRDNADHAIDFVTDGFVHRAPSDDYIVEP